MISYYEQLIRDYPLVSIEDPLSEDEWDSWSQLVSEVGDRVQIVGDDLFVTNRRVWPGGASRPRPPTRCWSSSTRSARSPRRSTR